MNNVIKELLSVYQIDGAQAELFINFTQELLEEKREYCKENYEPSDKSITLLKAAINEIELLRNDLHAYERGLHNDN